MLVRSDGASYDALRAGFTWRNPERFNIGTACADRHPAARPALVEVGENGERAFTFGDLTSLSNRLANALRGLGVEPGDRVGIVLPQCAETGIAHLALYKLGAIAIPMSILFGPQALMYRLGDADAKVVITDRARLDAIAEVARDLPGMQTVVVDDRVPAPHHAFWPLLEAGSDRFEAVDTTLDTPALLIYTSGTTGAPKGALHGHRVLLGHLPGFQLSHNFFPQDGDRFWTPADWAWIGGLMDALMPSWYLGRPVVAAPRHGFDPAWAVDLMARQQVRNVFLPPTVLKMMRQDDVRTEHRALRSIVCGGEPLGEEMLGWALEHLGVEVNEIYGQTEANYVVGNSADVWPVRPGSMGRPYPGHDVEILGPDSRIAAVDAVGEIAISTNDPVVFLRYWNRPSATEGKLTPDGAWLLTGDLGRKDAEGYVWFESRSDDVISSAGYRIGPAEIEECLMQHAGVTMAAAIGVPDAIRGEVVKAFVQLAPDYPASAELEQEIRQLVRRRLAAYEYPRQIEFVESLPLTTTGKIRRGALRDREQARDGHSSIDQGPRAPRGAPMPDEMTTTGVETTLFGHRVVLHDLAQEVSQQTQMHPLHPRVEVYPYESHANSAGALGSGFSYAARLLIMSDHASTHVDAMVHFDPDPDALTIDQMPLDTFCGDAVCVDLQHLPARAPITVEELQAALEKDGLEIRKGDIVLLHTGHFERTGGTPEYLTEFPGLIPESAQWLIDQGVKTFGNQAMSVDVPERYDFPVHQVCREAGITHIENIGALGAVSGRRFTVFGFPLKIVPGTGSPIRLVAAVPVGD